MNWEYLFKPQILDRGYEYHCDDAVENLNEGNRKVTAEVLGSDRYDVEITFDGDEIVDMYCTCPYAESANCKHMAAVLYQMEAEHKLEERKEHNPAETIEAIVNEAEEKDVRDFLIEALEKDRDLQMRFRMLVSKKITSRDIDLYKRRIDDIVREYAGYGDFIPYKYAYDFAMDLDEILTQDIWQMMELGNYHEAFELSCYILKTIAGVDMDDSDGGTSIVTGGCQDVWKSILEHTDMEDRRELFQWFVDHVRRRTDGYSYIEDFLMEEFQEREFIEEKLLLTDQKLGTIEPEPDFYGRYRQEKWVKRRIALMKALGKTEAQIEEFCDEYWQLPYVRQYMISSCEDRGDYDRAIEILLESMDMDKEYRGLVAGYGLDLKELYLETGQKEAYLDMLWKLALDLRCGDMQVYRELAKQYAPSQWAVEREKIFERLGGRHEAAEFFLEEKLYDRLLDYVKESPGLYALTKYEAELAKRYPAELLDKYRTEVEKMAKPTTSRKEYQHIVSVLRCMKKYPGGAAVTADLVRQWKTIYRNRRAMMEELNKV